MKIKYFILLRKLSTTFTNKIVLAVLLTVLSTIFEIFSIGLLYPLIGYVVGGGGENFRIMSLSITPSHIIVFFIISSILVGFLRGLLLKYITVFSHQIGHEVSKNIFKKYISQSYINHINSNSSNLVGLITLKTEAVIHYLVWPILNLFSAFFISFFIVCLLVFISPELSAVIAFVLILIYLIISKFIKERILNNGSIINVKNIELIKLINESMGNFRDIVIDKAQFFYLKLFDKIDLDRRSSNAAIEYLSGFSKYIIETSVMVLIGLYALLILKNDTYQISIPSIAVFAFASQRLLPLFQNIQNCITRLHAGDASVKSIFDEITVDHLPSAHIIETSQVKFNKGIYFVNVSFSYKPNEFLVLNSYNIYLEKGEWYGVIGRSGVGKSTFLDLLMGLLTPTSGSIYIDEVILSESNMNSWRNKISHVPQNVYVSDLSIAENIAFGEDVGTIDLSHLNYVIQVAELNELIRSIPGGINGVLGEHGSRLSGGQRQRLGIARALYKKNTEIIVLDEATNALDGYTQEKILASIKKNFPGLTCFIITHFPSTLHYCSKIIELKNSGVFLKDK